MGSNLRTGIYRPVELRFRGNHIPESRVSFTRRMNQETLVEWKQYWRGKSAYQMDTTGMAPYGRKVAFTRGGVPKTVTTFDQFGRPHLQYGFKEGHWEHQHTFTYPTRPRLGTGLEPLRTPKGEPIE